MKRQRGRGRKPGGNSGNRPLESNGPEVKIRGTAAQIYEKYAQYARDAQSSGDRVKYENFMQHAEHYFRIMMATMPRDRFPPASELHGDDRDGDDPSAEGLRPGDDADDEGDGGADEADGEAEAREDADERAGGDDAEGGSGGQERSDGYGRSRRRGRRHRRHEGGEAGGGDRGERPSGADPEARSALDMLARRQAAALGE
jgi:hypothetical protein